MADFDLITYNVRGLRDFKKKTKINQLYEKAQFKSGNHIFTRNTFH